MIRGIYGLEVAAAHLIGTHPVTLGAAWVGLALLAVGLIGIARHRARTAVETLPEGAVRGCDGQLHAIWAGYDGEGVYAWSCLCGDAASDFQGLDYAIEEGTYHLRDVGALVSA